MPAGPDSRNTADGTPTSDVKGAVGGGSKGTGGAARSPFVSRRALVRLLRTAIVVAILGLWEWAGAAGVVDRRFFGSPSGTLETLVDIHQSGSLYTNAAATMLAVAYSLAVGIPAGILAGAALGVWRFLDEVIEPFLVPFNSLPRLALAPLFILWFGLTATAKAAVAVSLIFFIVLFNTRAGIRSVDPDKVLVARSLNLTRTQIFRKVLLPDAAPVIFASIKLSVTYALLGVVGSEMIGARDGLGQVIVFYSATIRVSGVFAVLVVLALIGLVLARIMAFLERHALHWQEK